MASDNSATDAIATILEEHVDAVNATDVDLLLEGFTDDVVYIAAGTPPIVGKHAIRQYITPIYAQASIEIGMKSEGLEISGDRAVEWGVCQGEMTLEEDEPTPVNLQYMFVYRREPSGRWRISHDVSTPGPV